MLAPFFMEMKQLILENHISSIGNINILFWNKCRGFAFIYVSLIA